MCDDSPGLNSESGEGAGPGGIYGKNQVTLNDDKIWLYDGSYVDKVCVVYFSPYLYYEYIKLACVDIKKL